MAIHKLRVKREVVNNNFVMPQSGVSCESSVGNTGHHTAELTTSIFLCGLLSSVGMAAAFPARRWVPYA